MGFSIVILTQDEEINIAECLKSVSWCDDVHVVDSGSQDNTVCIVKKMGGHVLRRKFDNFGEQRNYALAHCAFKYQWVFHLDADERFTDELRDECEQTIREDKKSGFYVPSKLMLGNHWLKYSGCYPVYQMRFHKLGEVRFMAHGHGQRESESMRGIGFIKNPYLHYNFSKGLSEWCQKHVNYAKREATLQSETYSFLKLFNSDRMIRRRALKFWVARLPGRPFLKFCYLYFFKMGFLDGRAGFMYCKMHMFYEFMIMLFQWEAKTKKTGVKNEG